MARSTHKARDFKPGDVLLCVEGDGTNCLTGYQYTVSHIAGSLVRVTRPHGANNGFYGWRFEKTGGEKLGVYIIVHLRDDGHDHYGPFPSMEKAEAAAQAEYGESNWFVVELKKWEERSDKSVQAR